MSVVNGQDVEASVVNNALMSRLEDTSTVGKVALENADSTAITDIQKYTQQIADITGTFEGDLSGKNYLSENYITNGDSQRTAIGKLDSALDAVETDLTNLEALESSNNAAQQLMLDDHETRLDAAELILTDLQTRVDVIENLDSDFFGVKTFKSDVIIEGDLSVLGTVTEIASEQLVVTDPLITLNKNGNDLTAEGSGVEIERPLGNGNILFDSTLASKWKLGVFGSLYEVLVSGIAQTVTGIKDFVSGIKSDSLVESTLDAGVSIETVLLKDGLVDGRDISSDGAALDQAILDIADIETLHIADATIHFTESSISHLNIQDIGTNTHAQIDTHIASVANPHAVTASQVGLGNVTDDAQLKRAAADFDSFSAKTTPVVNDIVLIEDSEDSFTKKKITLTALLGGGGGGGGSQIVLKLNGVYGSITTPANYVDGLFIFPVAGNITNVFMYNLTAGSGGTTELDVKIKPFGSGSFTTIFSTTPKITNTAGADAWIGVGDVVTGATAPVLTSPSVAVAAKDGLRLDILTKQTGNPADCGVIIVWSPA